MTHPILKKAELILRQYAAGVSVDPADLDWAIDLALFNSHLYRRRAA